MQQENCTRTEKNAQNLQNRAPEAAFNYHVGATDSLFCQRIHLYLEEPVACHVETQSHQKQLNRSDGSSKRCM